jgi:ribosomal protein S15P/S13E
VALLTQKIADMAEHMKQHRKDFSSRRWGLGMRWMQRPHHVLPPFLPVQTL